MSEQVTLQKALITIKKLKQLIQNQQMQAEPIAIVGISCRFPDAIGKESFWRLLCEGRNVISKLPEERWELLKNTVEISLRDPEHPYWGGHLANIDAFDAYFFGISPREAVRMDPQHRLLLEVAYEAIEDAGLTTETLAGSNTGVFSSLDISQLAFLQKMESEMDALYLPTGNAISIAANRLSYLFDLRGPSIIIDSTCSSSMASLNMACLNIQTKACDMALVCGAKLNILPYVNYVLAKAKMLSPDGQCKTFDKEANGYVQGEGVGVIVLKPLKKALQDKDRIYAVVLGSAVNQDGKTNGLTAPNGLQQEALIKSALQNAKINPEDISYVECHGTGTFLGDPIEIEALGNVLGQKREKPCWISSVKTNIGHLEPAAGIASVIKVALSLYYKKIASHLNLTTENPHINFKKYHFQIPHQLEDWTNYHSVRIAAASGFGFGGTNAHVILRELREEEQVPQSIQGGLNSELFTISAKDRDALIALVELWIVFLKKNDALNLSQLCYNLHVRRTHYSYRVAVIATNIPDLIIALEKITQDPQKSDPAIFVNLSEAKKTALKKKLDHFENITLSNVAKSYIENELINWKKFEEKRSFVHMDMPSYAWQHKKYWPNLGREQHEIIVNHPLQPKYIHSPLQTIQFEFRLEAKHIPDVKETYHILHAGYYLEMFAYAAEQLVGKVSFTLEEHVFLTPLMIPANTLVIVYLILEKEDDHYLFSIHSNSNGTTNWAEHAKGRLRLQAELITKEDSIQSIQNRCVEKGTAEKLYEKITSMGIPAGESIRWTEEYWRNENEILSKLVQPKFSDKNSLFKLKVHPSLFDASIQPIFGLLPDDINKPYIAAGAECVKYYGFIEPPYYLLAQMKKINEDGKNLIGDLFLMNERGELMTEFNHISLTQIESKLNMEMLQDVVKPDLASLTVDEQKKTITQFLIDQISTILSIPVADLRVENPLSAMGMDSLSTLVLTRSIELGLGIAYPIQHLLTGPSINEIVQTCLENSVSVSPVTHTNPWISFRHKRAHPEFRLFCFPFGGGGASIYRDWHTALSDKIEICPIQLPGREERLNEVPLNQMHQLIDMLVDHLQKELTVPFGFFGHSFGSLIAFELTRRFRKLDLPMPSHLFVSAFPDPRTPTKSLDTLLEQIKAIPISLEELESATQIEKLNLEKLQALTHIFNENGLAGYGEVKPEIIKLLLPVFMGDMGLVKSYCFQEEAPLNIPITVFLGKHDTWVSYEDHLSWIDHTEKRCAFHEFDSGHLFIKDEAILSRILQIIARTVKVTSSKELIT